jgi:hypothetical protein
MAITDLLLAGKVVAAGDQTLNIGDVEPIPLNTDGRVRVASKQGYFPSTTGNLVLLNDSLPVDVTDASNVVMHVKNTGTATMAAGTFVFEGSIDSTNGTDGTWFGIQAALSNANTIVTSSALTLAAGAAQTYAWEASVNAVRWMRVRCSVAATANTIPTWTVVRGSYATEPIPALQTHAVTGSGNFSTAPAAATTQNAVSAATTNATLIKNTAANLMELSVFNPTAALVYVKLYNKTSAPTVGTDVPVMTIPVAVNSLVSLEFGSNGKRFGTGLSYAITAGPLSTDTAVIAAGVQTSFTHL